MEKCKKNARPWIPERKPKGKPTPSGYDRERSHVFYHSARWTREAKAFKDSHPLCVNCLKKGLLRPATVVDHIVPWPVCGNFWDQSNWQALCSRCNIVKGNHDKTQIQEHRRKEATKKQ